MTMKKQLLLILLTLLPKVASADDSGSCGDNLTWSFVESTGTLTISGSGNMMDYNNFIRPWTSIIDKISNVIIDSEVTSIGSSAFCNFTGLNSITIGGGVESIGAKAFAYCRNLKNIIIPNGVTVIERETFSGCSGLTSIIIPDGVSSIEDFAFSDCNNLTSITIPSSVTRIGHAFQGCGRLVSVYINNLEAWCNISFTSIIFDPVNMNSLHLYLDNEEITNLVIPNSVEHIKNYSFAGFSSLTSVSIPNSVKSIGVCSFEMCKSLKSVTIPSSVASIGESAFRECSSLISIEIPDGVKYISASTFSDCSNLVRVNIPNSIHTIGYCAFMDCSSLLTISLPSGLELIQSGAFFGCSSLQSIEIPKSVKRIQGGDSEYTNAGVFANCVNLTNIILPDGIEAIESSTFNGCSGLTSIIIPNSVLSIEKGAFNRCGSLMSIDIPSGVTSIGEYAFERCSGLTSINIPSSLNSIGRNAFENCSSLSSFNIPNSITSIADNVFSGCSGLTSIKIADAVTSIGKSAFSGCRGLSSIIIPNSVTTISENAFYGCSNASILILPDDIKYINKESFKGCSSLKEIIIPTNVEVIYQGAFADCSGLEDVRVLADTPPILYDNSFSNYNIPLYVPKLAIQSYQAQSPWNNFAQILNSDGTGYEINKCSTPIIIFKDGILSFSSETEGVQFIYQITDTDIHQGNSAEVHLSTTYNISVRATRSGFKDSDVATATFSWNGIEPLINGNVAKYRLSFIVENKKLGARTLEYGATITPPTADENGNSISWYTYPETMPAHDLMIYGMTVIQPEPEVFVWLTVKDGQSGTTKIEVKQGTEQRLNINPEEGWKLSAIMMDNDNVTAQLQSDGTFVTPALMSDATLTIVYEQETPSGVRTTTHSQADVKVVSDGVVISNAEPDTRCVVYQTDGKQVVNAVINEGTRKIALQKGEAYILTIDGRTLKFAL